MQNISFCRSCKAGDENRNECNRCENNEEGRKNTELRESKTEEQWNDALDNPDKEENKPEVYCGSEERTRTINILGKSVIVKNYICSSDGVNYRKKPENVQMQLFVCPTSYCPAGCPFCVAKNTKEKLKLDIDKFEEVMRSLKAEDRVRGVKITGGEPFSDIGLLNEVVAVLFKVFGYGLEIDISTNGIWLDGIHKIKDLEYIDSIHISRHHYDDKINQLLFGGRNNDIYGFQYGNAEPENGSRAFEIGAKGKAEACDSCPVYQKSSQLLGDAGSVRNRDRRTVPTGKELKAIIDSVPFKDIFVFSCMLLKDYINSPKEAHKFLDFAIETGVRKVGFMTCSPINKYAAEQSIPYEAVIKEGDPSLLFTRGYFDYEYCHCSDGVYSSEDGRIIEFYGRSTKMEKYAYSRGLVYDADNHLRDGFGGAIIV